ncbi:MAG: ROK family protein [Candidatus Azambacteria bacterium]|nr:ROK family protein [Candidatus Azambacteria bacterium]
MYLLFDIGGTNMRIAISRDGETIVDQKMVPTPADFEEGMRVFKKTAHELCGDIPATVASGGVPGILNKEKAVLLSAPNLKKWEDKPLREALERTLDVPVYLENDAALAGLGEAVFGAGKDKHIVAYFTVSTGVGGARVVDGRLDVGAFGFEPHRQIVDGTHTLGHYISGNGIKKRYGKLPEDLDEPAAWEEAAKWLAIGVNNAIALWSPEVFVLGGAVMRNRISIENVKNQVVGFGNFPEFPEIVAAQLGDASGLYGALALVRSLQK